MRAAVVGLGFGRFHAATLARLDGVELIGLCQRHAPDPPLDAFGAHYGVPTYTDPLRMLDEQRPDFVCVCTRPSARPALVEELARRGIGMLVEKPVAPSAADSERLAAFVAEHGAWAAVNFEMRELPPVRTLARLLAEGRLGAPLLAQLTYVMDPCPPDAWLWAPAEGGGPLYENSCHAFDLVAHLCGELEDVQAHAVAGLSGDPRRPDGAVVSARSARGAAVTMCVGAVGTPAREVPMRLELFCGEGHATLSGSYHTFSRLEYALRDGTADVEAGRASRGEPGPFDESILLAPGLERAVADFRAGRPPAAPLAAAVAAARIAERAVAGAR